MDDTIAMQDTNGPSTNGHATAATLSKGGGGILTIDENSTSSSSGMMMLAGGAHQQMLAELSGAQQQPLQQQLQQPFEVAGLADVINNSSSGGVGLSPRGPQLPSMMPQQQVSFDTASVASDGSQEQGGSGSKSQHGPPRRAHSAVDVDMAKQAAMSALAGLDMSTTKANLDASKAAAATARANGEVPAHVRKSNLRSVSCRQLGTGGVGKSVAFDEASKAKPADGAAGKTVQWRPGTASSSTASSTDGSAPRRTTRAPASRCISLPHVLQGRAGMANRLAATYAQDAALQQQLQLLNGGAQAGTHAFAAGVNQLQGGMPNMDVLSMYQLQQQANGQLLSQRSLGINAAATMDDSMLQLRSGGNALLAAQQQQQAARMQAGGNWPNGPAAAAGQQRVSWAPGTAQVPQQSALANQQLMMQLQGAPQALPAGNTGSNEALWLQNPAAASAALLAANRPQNLLLPTAAGGAGLAGLAASSGLLSPHLQQQPAAALGGGDPSSAVQTSTLVAVFTQLLEQYQAVSWTVLAAAQADSNIREQLLTEVVLQLTLLHTLSGVLKSTLSPADALSDLSYLGTAARRHIATFSRLSQAGDLAVQLLAMISPLACRHLTTSDVTEAAFLVLDTLALANRDVSAVVTQQRLTALGNLLMQLPMDQLLQQQTLGLAWINSMAAAVNRNKQVLETLAGADPTGQAGASAALMAGAGAGVGLPPGIGLSASSQPLMVSPTSATLSPTGKTPLATYFEENPTSGLVSPSGAAAAAAAGGAAGLGAVGGLTAADEAVASLAHLQLGVGPAAVGPAAASAAGVPRPYSPLEGAAGLPLFGDTLLLAPGSSAANGAANSSGVPAGIVGV